MEELKIVEDCSFDQFFDALDEYRFFDCISKSDSREESEDSSKPSQIKSFGDKVSEVIIKDTHSSESRFPNGLRHRSSFRSDENSKDSVSRSQLISEIIHVIEGVTPRERRNQILYDLKDSEKVREGSDCPRFGLSSDGISGEHKQSQEGSSITSENGDSYLGEPGDSSSSFLVFLAGLIIRSIGFQISLFVSFFTFPIWLLYCSFVFITDPIQALKQAKERITEKLMRKWGAFCESLVLFLKGQESFWKLVLKFGWGLLWSIYVGFMLSGLLIIGFVVGGVIMRYLVEEPIRMTETLNFDYTKASPVANVPIMFCPCVSNGVNCKEMGEVRKHEGSRVIPLYHKLQFIISLTLPESEYNRKLGVFQVRVDLLSKNGEVTGSSSHPCMMRFKSHLISYLETFLKSVPLLAGYSSETQVLNLKVGGFTEGYKPTSCLRVILEQRAHYRPSDGIPEIYAASLVLESELPLFKRILWYWKTTIFIWLSLMVFVMELLLILLCCRPILMPRPRLRDGSVNNNVPQNTASQVVSS